MPAIVLPAPQSTNLGILGGVLAERAGDYSREKRVDELRAQERANRLADIESERQYNRTEGDRTYARGRTDLKEDEKRRASQRLTDTAAMNDIQWLELLVKSGYLNRGDMTNPDAVANANAMAEADGMTRRARDESEQAFKERQRTNAVTALNQIAKERAKLQQQYEALNNVLAAPAPVLTDKQVIDATMARLSQGGKTPTFKEIQEAAPMVREELQGAIFMQEKAEKDRALIQKSMLADNIRALTTRADAITSKTGAIEDIDMTPPPAAADDTGKPTTKGTGKTFDQLLAERYSTGTTRPGHPEFQARNEAYYKARINDIGTFGSSGAAAAPTSRLTDSAAAPAPGGPPATTRPIGADVAQRHQLSEPGQPELGMPFFNAAKNNLSTNYPDDSPLMSGLKVAADVGKMGLGAGQDLFYNVGTMLTSDATPAMLQNLQQQLAAEPDKNSLRAISLSQKIDELSRKRDQSGRSQLLISNPVNTATDVLPANRAAPFTRLTDPNF